MIHTAVIPDCQVIDILPSVPDLKIMVLYNKLDEPIQSTSTLFGSKLIDMLHVVAHRKYRFPSGYRIGTDDGVLCG
jgi:hypothetical protein